MLGSRRRAERREATDIFEKLQKVGNSFTFAICEDGFVGVIPGSACEWGVSEGGTGIMATAAERQTRPRAGADSKTDLHSMLNYRYPWLARRP